MIVITRRKKDWLRWGMGVVASLGLGACASAPQSNSAHPLLTDESISEPVTADSVVAKGGRKPGQISELKEKSVVSGVEIQNTDFDIPVTVNGAVEKWVQYFVGRGRPHFSKYLERSDYFVPYIRPILKQNGLPEDLVYLAMIESGFSNHAYSHARAVGPWQFMAATGKRYGLKVNWWIDERRDIRKSTLAAARYIGHLNSMFGSWELAAASYNAGEYKIARAVQRYGTRNFWTLARHPFLKPETRNYVPKMMAAAILSKNRELFGFPPEKVIEELEPDALPDEEQGGDVLARVLNEYEDPEDPESSLEAPGETAGMMPAALVVEEDENSGDTQPSASDEGREASGVEVLSGKKARLARPMPIPHVSKQGEVGGEELAEFEVQSPADLLKIARASGLSYRTVKRYNPEILRWCTPPQLNVYRIKLPVSVKEKFLLTYNHPAFPREIEFRKHKVRPGDGIAWIARHYGVDERPILELNGLRHRSAELRVGRNILLPLPTDRRSSQLLDVRDAPPPKRQIHRRSRRNRA